MPSPVSLIVAAGIGYVIAIALFLIGLGQLDRHVSGSPTLATSALVGLVAGVIVAAAGAWKHAPQVGFEGVRFIRSPLLVMTFAVALSSLADSYLCLTAAAVGCERVAVGAWKAFCAYIASRLRDGPWA